MDLPRYAAMSRYWDAHPPIHLMVQGYLGIEGKKQVREADNDESSLREFMEMFGSSGGVVK